MINYQKNSLLLQSQHISQQSTQQAGIIHISTIFRANSVLFYFAYGLDQSSGLDDCLEILTSFALFK